MARCNATNQKGSIMKSLLIATALVATSFAASAEYKGIRYEPGVNNTTSAHQSRATAAHQTTAATKASTFAFSESAMRAAERKALLASRSASGQTAQTATVAWGEQASGYAQDGQ
jgi:hypothetical protein